MGRIKRNNEHNQRYGGHIVVEIAKSIVGTSINDAINNKILPLASEVFMIVFVGGDRRDAVKSDCTVSMPYRQNPTCSERLSVWCHSPVEANGTYRAGQRISTRQIAFRRAKLDSRSARGLPLLPRSTRLCTPDFECRCHRHALEGGCFQTWSRWRCEYFH